MHLLEVGADGREGKPGDLTDIGRVVYS